MKIKWLAVMLYSTLILSVSYSMFSAQETASGIQSAQVSIPLNTTSADMLESGQFLADDRLQLHASTDTPAGVFLSRPVRVPLRQIEPFLSVGSLWDISVPVNDASGVELSLRVANKHGIWQNWQALDHLHYLEDGRQYAHLLQFDANSRDVQVRIQWDTSRLTAPVDVRAIQLSFISPGTDTRPIEPTQQTDISGTQSHSVPVVSRTNWGCPDGQGSRWTPQYTTVTHFIVHHTVTSNTSSNWSATVRAIWNYHALTLGWGDIGYNYLIDPTGTVYEGRAGGNGSIGAHFSCANGNTMGVALLGTYSTVTPSAAMLNSLEQLLAEKASTFNLDPLGSSYHASSLLTLNTISGHRDGNSMSPAIGCPSGTVCPGNVAYSLLPSIRSGTYALLPPNVDVNNDGRVTPADVIYVINRLSGSSPSADVNDDGQVTFSDVQMVLDELGN